MGGFVELARMGEFRYGVTVLVSEVESALEERSIRIATLEGALYEIASNPTAVEDHVFPVWAQQKAMEALGPSEVRRRRMMEERG